MTSTALDLSRRAFPEKALPSGWDIIDLEFESKNYTGFDIPAKTQPRAIIAFLTGCHSSPILFPDEIEQFSDAGYRVLGLPQPNKFQSENPVSESARLTQWFLLDPQSPLHASENAGLPIIIVSHCAGSLMTINALMTASEEQLAPFKHIFYAAPFLDIPKFISAGFQNAGGALRFLNHTADFARVAYAKTVADEMVGYGPAEKLKYRITHRGQSRPAPKDHWGRPTYAQALQLQKIGRFILKTLTEGTGSDFKNTPQSIFSSSDDPNVCKDATFTASRILRASCINSTAAHDLLREDPNVMSYILSIVDKIAPRPEPAEIPTLETNYREVLLGCFRLAAQSGARSLDTGARLFQRFFGRGVGYPEIG